MTKQEMVKLATWVLCLCDENTDLPIYYYNHTNDTFQREFHMGCAFLDEKSCVAKQKEMPVEGLQLVKGTMDYPKDVLAGIVVDTFEESGLI